MKHKSSPQNINNSLGGLGKFAIHADDKIEEEAFRSASSFSSSKESSSQIDSELSRTAMTKNKNISLQLEGKGLQRLDFLIKFVTEFPHVASIELEYNRIDNKDFNMLHNILKTNLHITDIKFKKGNYVLRPTKKAIKDELEKNRRIKELGAQDKIITLKDANGGQMKVLDLQSLELSDTKFLTKLI